MKHRKEEGPYDSQVRAWGVQLHALPDATATEVVRIINDVFYKAKKGLVTEAMQCVTIENSQPTSIVPSPTGLQAYPQDNLATYFSNFSGDSFQSNM